MGGRDRARLGGFGRDRADLGGREWAGSGEIGRIYSSRWARMGGIGRDQAGLQQQGGEIGRAGDRPHNFRPYARLYKISHTK